MFAKKGNEPNRPAAAAPSAPGREQGATTNGSYKPTVAPIRPPAEIPRPRPDDPSGTAQVAASQERRMTVGPGIGLKGEITNCDILVVEGAVEATLECKLLEVVEGGAFNGEASVECAEIHGNYDGTLTVAELMRIHDTGCLSGKARYGKIEIQTGGELSGDIASAAFEASGRKATPPTPLKTADDAS
jgi:cytoskeletal protein CcmA (bactofilin family)